MPRRARHYWLLKTEPGTYSVGDLARDGETTWEGVRNYQARNHLRDGMKVGDLALIYHSNAKVIGAVGVARVSRNAEPDPTAFQKRSPYYDPKSDPEAPRWVQVHVEHVETFDAVVTLDAMKDDPRLDGMLVTRKGQRLSVQPVERGHFARVLRLAKANLRVRP